MKKYSVYAIIAIVLSIMILKDWIDNALGFSDMFFAFIIFSLMTLSAFSNESKS